MTNIEQQLMGTVKGVAVPDIKGIKPRSKLGNQLLYPFLFGLLNLNEELPESKKLHDGLIAMLVKQQYSEYPEVIKSIDDCPVSRIAIWRSTYNRGLLGQLPRRCSFRYNSDGQAVDGQTGSKLLSREDMRIICQRYEIDDTRFMERKM